MAHAQKYDRSSIVGLAIHYERRSGCELSNKDIDVNRSQNNYNLAQSLQPLRPEEFISKRINEVKHINRKDIVVMVDWIVTLPKNVKEEDEQKFFESVFNFMKQEYGQKNIVCAWVHNDEKTPHIHVGFVPVIIDNDIERLNCKKIITRNHLKDFHTRLSDYIEPILGYSPEILNGATINGNRTIKELKNQEDICLEKAKNNIQDNIAISKELAIQAENIECEGSLITKVKSLSQANKIIKDLTVSNNKLSIDNDKLIKVIGVQKKEIDMYRAMPLAKRVKEKERIIDNLYSSIESLEKRIEDHEYDIHDLKRRNLNLAEKKEKLEQQLFIHESFLSLVGLDSIFKEFKRIFKQNDLSINICSLEDICSKAINKISKVFDTLKERILFLDSHNLPNDEFITKHKNNYKFKDLTR